ncbi:uncharacterized protein LOC144730235 isoform X2 [Lampetra planeri]
MEAKCGGSPCAPRPRARRPGGARPSGQAAATLSRFASGRSRSRPDAKGLEEKRGIGGATSRTAGVIDPHQLLVQAHEASFSKIYTLELHARGIKKIENLEKFTRLRSLDLSCNYIKSIEGLEHLKDLRELKLYGNKITIIQNLSRLNELQILHLQHNQIIKIGTALEGKQKLKELRLDSNRLSRLSPREVAQLSSLQTLDISHNQLTDVTAVSVLPSLEELQACGNQLSGIPELSCCEQLKVLDLSDNRITQTVDHISLPKHLNALNLSGNVLSSLESFGILSSLQDLDLSCNKIQTLRGISELFPLLETLNIANNLVSSWQDLKLLGNCMNLLELCVNGNPAITSNNEHSRYQQELTTILPHLEILDGVSVTSKQGSTAINIRPMTANSGKILGTNLNFVNIKLVVYFYGIFLYVDISVFLHGTGVCIWQMCQYRIVLHLIEFSFLPAMISQKLVGQMESLEGQMEATLGSLQQRFSEVRCLVVNSLPQVSPPRPTSVFVFLRRTK